MFGGSVTETTNYNNGEIANLVATPNSGYNFYGWTENKALVSNNTNYSFTVSSDRTLVANFVYSTQIVDVNKEAEIVVYPNPATNYLNIKFLENKNQNIKIYMYDYTGKKCQINTINKNSDIIELDVSFNPAGIYFLRIVKEGKVLDTRKIIITK